MLDTGGRRNKREARGSWNLEVTRSCREWSRKPETAGSQRQPGAEGRRKQEVKGDEGSSPTVCSDVLSGGELVVCILYQGC